MGQSDINLYTEKRLEYLLESKSEFEYLLDIYLNPKAHVFLRDRYQVLYRILEIFGRDNLLPKVKELWPTDFKPDRIIDWGGGTGWLSRELLAFADIPVTVVDKRPAFIGSDGLNFIYEDLNLETCLPEEISRLNFGDPIHLACDFLHCLNLSAANVFLRAINGHLILVEQCLDLGLDGSIAYQQMKIDGADMLSQPELEMLLRTNSWKSKQRIKWHQYYFGYYTKEKKK